MQNQQKNWCTGICREHSLTIYLEFGIHFGPNFIFEAWINDKVNRRLLYNVEREREREKEREREIERERERNTSKCLITKKT
jgi:hypothetical protein